MRLAPPRNPSAPHAIEAAAQAREEAVQVDLLSNFKALDGASIAIKRVVDLPLAPFPGLSLEVDDRLLSVQLVYVTVDIGLTTAVVVFDSEELGEPVPLPQTRADLLEYVARFQGWAILPVPPRLAAVR